MSGQRCRTCLIPHASCRFYQLPVTSYQSPVTVLLPYPVRTDDLVDRQHSLAAVGGDEHAVVPAFDCDGREQFVADQELATAAELTEDSLVCRARQARAPRWGERLIDVCGATF